MAEKALASTTSAQYKTPDEWKGPLRSAWIVGRSFVLRTGRWAEETKESPPFRNTIASWWGYRGLLWADIHDKLADLVAYRDPPEFLIIHLGGNDLVSVGRKNVYEEICASLSGISHTWRDTEIYFSSILPRRKWQGAISYKTVDISRRKLNRGLEKYCLVKCFRFMKHPFITLGDPDVFHKDGTQLLEQGMEYFFREISSTLATRGCK
ncbi:uncharacterized protein [Ambystoma mexicanum]|uniref:uncharacterized protein n=1 Tax=Ambystoma mexicanum TaxID=8296 RepID=UPI0037E736B2